MDDKEFDARRFEAKARELETLAQRMSTEKAKKSLLDAARYWRALGDQAAKLKKRQRK